MLNLIQPKPHPNPNAKINQARLKPNAYSMLSKVPPQNQIKSVSITFRPPVICSNLYKTTLIKMSSNFQAFKYLVLGVQHYIKAR